MADLNELTQFEKDLKNLIESRNNYKPRYKFTDSFSSNAYMPFSEEDSNLYNNRCGSQMTMLIPEHGRIHLGQYQYTTLENNKPLTLEEIESLHKDNMNKSWLPSPTFMGVPEHGQPYTKNDIVTFMAVKEHGQPYNEPMKNGRTDMVISEHDKQYAYNTNDIL